MLINCSLKSSQQCKWNTKNNFIAQNRSSVFSTKFWDTIWSPCKWPWTSLKQPPRIDISDDCLPGGSTVMQYYTLQRGPALSAHLTKICESNTISIVSKLLLGFWISQCNLVINLNQEPITRSVKLPYSVCETAFSQAGLFLDQPFPLEIRPFHFFSILLKVSLTIAKAREKLTGHGFNRKNSHSEKCIKGMPLLHLHMWEVQIKCMELWEGQFKEWWLKWRKTTSGKRNTVAKTTEFRHHRFYSDFDADVTRNSKFSGKGISKNNSTCENAVSRK